MVCLRLNVVVLLFLMSKNIIKCNFLIGKIRLKLWFSYVIVVFLTLKINSIIENSIFESALKNVTCGMNGFL